MKPAQQSKPSAEKKSQVSLTPLMGSPAVTAPGAGKSPSASSFGSPPGAVWSRYIDSRMKQFGTR
jgi:hypothetical protein